MRFISTSLVILLYHAVFGQITDSFSDGNFTENPTWSGDTLLFNIESNTLHLTGFNETGVAYLSTKSLNISAIIYEFTVKMEFNPSNQNFCDIYLYSSNPDLSDTLQGYFVRIGTSNDEISLYYQDGFNVNKIIDGIDDLVDRDIVEVRVKASRNNSGQWSLYADTTAGTDYFLIGRNTQKDYPETNYFGFKCTYTSSRSDKFYFDDISINPDPEYVSEPLRIDTVKSLTSNSILVMFNKRIEIGPATDVHNYMLYPDEKIPDSVSLMAKGNAIRIFFENLKNNMNYRIGIYNISDEYGNELTNSNYYFTYYTPHQAIRGDIIINELMADPNPVVGLPHAEYVELYNVSEYAININRWKLNNKLLPNSILFPNDYTILCKKEDVSLFNDVQNIIGMDGWNSINNTGEEIILVDDSSRLINKMLYDPAMIIDSNKKHGGWSIERINPFLPCDHSANWHVSIHPNGGTPAKKNSVYNNAPDMIPPALIGQIINNDTLTLMFSEPINISENIYNQILIQKNKCNKILGDQWNCKIIITVDEPFIKGKTYELRLEGIDDCSGNVMKDTTCLTGVGRIPSFQELVVTEVMSDPYPSAGLPELEYIELYNTSLDIISLQNCKLVFAEDTIAFYHRNVYPQKYIIITKSTGENLLKPFGDVLGIKSMPTIDNYDEQFYLIDSDYNLIHTFHFTKDLYGSIEKNDGGFSVEMIDANYPHRNGNWRVTENSVGGTPGQKNSISEDYPDLLGPRLLQAIPIEKDSIKVSFNEKLHPYKLIDISVFIEEGIDIQDIYYKANTTETITIKLLSNLKPGRFYTLTVHNISDCSNNIIQQDYNSISFILPEVPDSSDIIINEILFNPEPGGSEFIELYNASHKYIDLHDFVIMRYSNGSPYHSALVTSNHLILHPDSYLALCSNPKILKADFPFAPDENLLMVRQFPILPNDAGEISLLMQNGKITDHLLYDEKFHNKLIFDHTGISLERISPNHITNDPENWHSAASTSGYGTPGEVNSQNINQEFPGEIFIDPKMIVPDYNDVSKIVTINYRMDNPGYNANVEIYDIQGRKVKTIAQNAIMGIHGFFTWDGSTDGGSKANTGYYLIMIEIWNLKGDVRKFKEPVVIGTKF